MNLNRETSTAESTTITEVIQAIASDAAHDVLYDIVPTLSQHIPVDLPIEVWNNLCESFEGDMKRLIQNRLQWFAQSIQAETNEVRRIQRQQATQQALWEKQEEARRLDPQPAPAPDLPEIKVIYSRKPVQETEPVSSFEEKPTSQLVKAIPSRRSVEQPNPIKTTKTTPEPVKAIETRQYARIDRTYQQTDLFNVSNEYPFAQTDHTDDTEAKSRRLRRLELSPG
jgi:hypothetical protein